MLIYTQSRQQPIELNVLVQNILVKHPVGEIYRNELFLNDDGQLVWELYKDSYSKTEPVSRLVYEVVQ